MCLMIRVLCWVTRGKVKVNAPRANSLVPRIDPQRASSVVDLAFVGARWGKEKAWCMV
jgi:hypothetical protein